jgi:hypothetical protein
MFFPRVESEKIRREWLRLMSGTAAVTRWVLCRGIEAILGPLRQQALSEIEALVRFLELPTQNSNLVFQGNQPVPGVRIEGLSPGWGQYPGDPDARKGEDRDDGNQRAEYAGVHEPSGGLGLRDGW